MTRLDELSARLPAALGTLRAGVDDTRATVAELPTSRIDGTPWGEVRQSADARLIEIDRALTELARAIEEREA